MSYSLAGAVRLHCSFEDGLLGCKAFISRLVTSCNRSNNGHDCGRDRGCHIQQSRRQYEGLPLQLTLRYAIFRKHLSYKIYIYIYIIFVQRFQIVSSYSITVGFYLLHTVSNYYRLF